MKIRDTWYNVAHIMAISPFKGKESSDVAYVLTFSNGMQAIGITEEDFKRIMNVSEAGLALPHDR